MNLVEQHMTPRIRDLVGVGNHGLDVALRQLTSLNCTEPRGGPYTGIKALMLAVMEEGVLCYLGRDERARREAADWIASAGRRSPFAFTVVCETLGLEPSAVRIALQRLQATTRVSRTRGRRIRPNAKRAYPATRRPAQPPPSRE